MPFPAVPWEVWGLFRWIFALWKNKKQSKTYFEGNIYGVHSLELQFWFKIPWGMCRWEFVLIFFVLLLFFPASPKASFLKIPSFKGFFPTFFGFFCWNNPIFECFWSFLRFGLIDLHNSLFQDYSKGFWLLIPTNPLVLRTRKFLINN